MSTSQEVRIPDIGDIEHVEVIEICVAVGDEVGPDDGLIVIESDKASMEVPAGAAGKILSVDVAVGDEVTEGTLVVTLAPAGSEAEVSAGPDAEQAVAEPGDAALEVTAADAEVSQGTADAEQAGRDAGPEPKMAPRAGADAATESPARVEVRVPDIGEATEVVVVEVGVEAGAEVGADDLLVVVESDKASMEIPAGFNGTVEAVHVEVGTEVEEGTLLATISTSDGSATAAAADTKPAEAKATRPAKETTREETRAQEPGGTEEEARPAEPSDQPAHSARPSAGAPESRSDVTAAEPTESSGERVYAGPAVRRLARELGVDLKQVSGTGNRGRIVKDDVKSYVKTAMTGRRGEEAAAGFPQIPAVDFSKFGPVEMQPLSRIRAAGAKNLHRSWLNLPHVTQFEEADVTELEAFRATLKEEAARRNVKITPLAFIVKACCYALQAFPTFNASLDPDIKNYVLKKYYHIGFAVDTPDGLVVPVIRDANRMGVWDLSAAIAELAEKARTQSLALNDMQGGTFSISSLGGIGGTGFTPIINAPELAILGVSRLVTRPMWDGSEFTPRQMLPLSLSYDHRAINGAEAGRFMAMLAELLGDIRRLSL